MFFRSNGFVRLTKAALFYPMKAMLTLSLSRIGLHLGDLEERVLALGAHRFWSTGDCLCRRGETARSLHVLLDGHVRFEGGGFGPGAHTGEIGFLLGVPRTADVVADQPVETWTVNFDDLSHDPEAATVLLIALALELPSRIRKLRPPAAPDADFCDADHPALVALADALRGENDAATARAIWRFVSDMPYRFGIWWQRASETLRQGWGMCTTKSNLEVALFRAAGLEAGFVMITADSMIIRPLIPDAWQDAIKPGMKHFFGAVKLEDRWHAADASFTRPLLRHFATRFPEVAGLDAEMLNAGHPFHPAARASGEDPFAIEVLPSLDHAMARRSSHDIDRLEVMNVVVDRLQGPVFDLPPQLIKARDLLQDDPGAAFALALSVAATMASDLRGYILEPA